QQDVTRVAIAPLFAWLEIERLVAETRNQLLRGGSEWLLGRVVREAGETRNPRGVGQQVEDGNLVPRGGRIRHELLHYVVSLQLAAILQQQDRGRCELLGDGPQPELSGG